MENENKPPFQPEKQDPIAENQAQHSEDRKANFEETEKENIPKGTPYIGQSFVTGVPAKDRLKLGGARQQTLLMLLMLVLLAAFLIMLWSFSTGLDALVFNPRSQIYESNIPEDIQGIIEENQNPANE